MFTGFIHEHQRKDRDEHLKIFNDNIQNDQKQNFIKCPDCDLVGTKYDSKSIMHYHQHSFGRRVGPGQKTTIALKGKQWWQVWSLSSLEVSRQLVTNDLNQVSCVSLPMTSWTALANGGLFELTLGPLLTRVVLLSLAVTTEEPGCSQVKD